MPKDITNLTDDVKHWLARFNENRLKYCNRIINRDTDMLTKTAQL